MSTVVSHPGKVDLIELSQGTRHALEKLAPFYIEGTKRSVLGFGGPPKMKEEVATQTATYVRAINGSIDASTFGYTLAQEAIGITKYILNEGKLTPDLDDYTKTASELAAKGKDKAAGAVELFLDAKTKLNELISKYDNADEVKDKEKAALKDCLDALTSLQPTLEQYVRWWIEMDMKHTAVKNRAALSFNKIRYQTLLEEWQDLRVGYVGYNATIQLAKSDFPEVFKAIDSDGLRSKRASPHATDSEDSLVSHPGKIDLIKLSKDTSHALEKLAPFYMDGTKRSVFGFGGPPKMKKEVATQTTSYVRAIKASIDASTFGYTLAEEAIGVTKYILKEGKLTPDLDDYTSIASELAAKGKDKAAGAVKLFLDAETQLNELISKYDNADEVKERERAMLNDCLDALLSLQPTLEQYVTWWIEMDMKHTAVKNRASLSFNKIRYQTLLEEWQDLRVGYVGYNATIQLAKSDFPEVFKAIDSDGLRSERASPHTTDSEDSLVSHPGKVDLIKLSKDTSHALEKLAPFYIEGSKRSVRGFGGPPKMKKEVATQTTSYVRAINGSIDASTFGYTLAQEAIGVTKYILREGKLTPDLDDYTRTASELAAKGKDKAAGAVKLFLDAKTKLNELISKYDNADEVKEKERAVLKDCLDALTSLQPTLEQYVRWWIEMDMKHTAVKNRTALSFNKIRYQTLLEEWQYLRVGYIGYNATIQLAKSDFPEVFKAIDYDGLCYERGGSAVLPDERTGPQVTTTDSEDSYVSPPGKIDLIKLSKDTSRALEKLAPFYIEGSKRSVFGFGGPSKMMKEVTTETTSYVRAINGSIDASTFGYTLAEEAIGVTKYTLQEGKLPPDLDDYISTASELAAKGRYKAAAALELFLDARIKLNELISKYNNANQANDKEIAMLKDCLDALMSLQSTLNEYVSWWNEMERMHSTVQDRTALRFNKIRYQAILEQWQDLRGRYVAYNRTIQLVKSDFPEVFKAIAWRSLHPRAFRQA